METELKVTAGDAGEDRDWLFYYFEKWLCDDILGQTPRKSDWRCWKWKVQKSEIGTSEISNVHCTSMYEGNDLWMEWTGMDHTLWKLPFSAAFWVPTWVCSGELMERYEGFENLHIRWNGWLITMVMEVPALFRRGLDPILVIKIAIV